MDGDTTPSRIERLLARLRDDLAARSPLLVAFSGGVDSGVVAALARQAAGHHALAVTAAAETLAGIELDHARQLAGEIGIEHRIVTYSELDSAEFRANPAHRCYVCQGMRMGTMQRLARELGYRTVCDGTNASDLGPSRPGLAAVREQGVYSPLLEHDVDKPTTRAIARHLGLSAWDRPANACLSSRIPHGQVVTLGKLRRIEAAEERLLGRGFEVVRVRSDRGCARVEVAAGEVARLRGLWGELSTELLELGFDRVTLDPRGYRTGGADLPAPETAEAVGG
jgi:uncharacterized protein (TIGR00268 family)